MNEAIYAERMANMQYKQELAVSVEKVVHAAGGAVIVRSSANGSVHGHTASAAGAGAAATAAPAATTAAATTGATGPAASGTGSLKLLSSSPSHLPHSPKRKIGAVAGVTVAGTHVVPSTTGSSIIAGPRMKRDSVQHLGRTCVATATTAATATKGPLAAGSGARAAKAIPK